jgi:hypothetical protein
MNTECRGGTDGRCVGIAHWHRDGQTVEKGFSAQPERYDRKAFTDAERKALAEIDVLVNACERDVLGRKVAGSAPVMAALDAIRADIAEAYDAPSSAAAPLAAALAGLKQLLDEQLLLDAPDDTLDPQPERPVKSAPHRFDWLVPGRR